MTSMSDRLLDSSGLHGPLSLRIRVMCSCILFSEPRLLDWHKSVLAPGYKGLQCKALSFMAPTMVIAQ